MAITPATARLAARATTPPAPSPGYVLLYFKTDNVLYIQGSDAVEHAIGTVNDITDLHGDVTANGPGNVLATVVSVGGKLAAEITQSVNDTQAATSLSVISTIVKRDASGNVSVNLINGVSVQAHGSRHNPGGADPVSTAAPIANLNANTTNQEGTAGSLARSDHSHDIDTAAPVGQAPDQTNAAGSVLGLAKADHIHNIPTASAVGLNANSTSTQGSASTFTRADHTHHVAAGPVSTQIPDQANTEGSSNNFSRADHIHNIATDVPVQANADSNNIKGVSTSFARADHKHDILVGTPISQTPDQANALGSSTSLARADHRHNIPTAAPITQNTDQANSDGVAATFSRSDHVHNVPTDVPVSQIPDQSNASGSSSKFSKADHIHDVPTGVASGLDSTSSNTQGIASAFTRQDHTHHIASGVPSSQTPDQSNAAGTSPNFAKADHIHDIPTASPVADLNASTSNTQGTAASFSRSDHSHAIDTASPVTQNTDQANAAGISANLSRADHVHNVPTDVPIQVNANGVNNQGVSTKFSRADHKHDIATAVPVTQNTDQANAAGASSSLSRADHVHDIPTDVPVILNPDIANTQGISSKFSKADHIHDVPTDVAVTQTPDQTNAQGASTKFARADHVHDIPTGVASGLDSTSSNTQGSTSAFARQDHTHHIASGAPVSQTPDQANAAGSSANFSKADHVHNIPTAAPITQNTDQANSDGVAATFSRSDHVHNVPTDVPVQIGTSNSQGASAKFAKADHIHAHGAQTDPTLHAIATGSANGFLSASDKAKLDAATDANTPSTLVKRDASGNFSANIITATFNGQALDSSFKIENASDITKVFNWDLSGLTTAVTVTLKPLLTANGVLQIQPLVDPIGNILIQNTTSGQVFIGANATIGGSNSGIQYSDASTANRAQIKLHSYFNGTSIAGVSTLTSRSGIVGTNSTLSAGQDYSKWTAQAAATTPGSAPISGTWAFKANSINSLTVPTDFHIQLTNLAGTLADRFYLTSEGALSLSGYSTGIAHFDSSGNVTSSSITNSDMAQMPANTIKGNNTGSSATPLDLTIAQLITMIGAITSLTSDVTASGPGAAAATVNSVGGSSAANIHSAELAANAATSSNTSSTIVKRDANGDSSHRDLTLRNILESGYQEIIQVTAPATPGATKVRIYNELSNGFSRLRVVDETGLVLTLLRDTTFMFKNVTGSTINKGQVVYVTGADAASGVITVGLAKANSSSTVPALGLTLDTVANNGFGRVLAIGIINGIDTSAFSVGDRVYLSPTTLGGLTNIKPSQPNIWQRIGVVITSNVSTGSIEIRPLATHGEEIGTNQNSFTIGDGTSGNKALQVNNGFVAGILWNPASAFNLILPPTQGAAGTYLNNDGAGNLSWTNPNVNIDGGSASTIYTASQLINGGTA